MAVIKYVVLVLALCFKLVSTTGPCDNTNCGVASECFHYMNHEFGRLEAVCLDESARVEPSLNGVRVYKHCPENNDASLFPFLGCGVNPQNMCELDTDCNHSNEKCCYDGCSNKCRKFILRPFQ